MYKIIGGDKKEYGPASADELRHWVTEGRLSGQSLIQAEGSNEWKPLASFAEFADAVRVQTGPSVLGGPIAPPVSAEAWSAQILARPAELQIGRCLAQSGKLLKENFGLLFSAAFLVWLISLSEFIPLIGFVYKVLAGVFYGGLYLIVLNRIRGKPASAGEVFAGFNQGFAQLLLAGFVTLVLGTIGLLFCFVPGIYLLIAWAFSVPLVADKRLEFWSAMELSRKVVTRVWFEVFGLVLVAFLPVVLVSIISVIMLCKTLFAAIHEILASGQPDVGRIIGMITNVFKVSFPLTLLVKFVFLLNLPFALGALMYAYENLFGTRPAPNA